MLDVVEQQTRGRSRTGTDRGSAGGDEVKARALQERLRHDVSRRQSVNYLRKMLSSCEEFAHMIKCPLPMDLYTHGK